MVCGRGCVGAVVAGITAVAWPGVGCDRACDDYFLGKSTLNHQVASDWPYGDGTAAGVWEVTLFPTAFGTNCVEVDEGSFQNESYAYTLEFVQEGGQEVMNLYVDGTLFATGSYTDEAANDVADHIAYETGIRVADNRPGGTISYMISGSAELEVSKSSGSLTWYGEEVIVVLTSRDPEISPECTFRYEVVGFKVCDE